MGDLIRYCICITVEPPRSRRKRSVLAMNMVLWPERALQSWQTPHRIFILYRRKKAHPSGWASSLN